MKKAILALAALLLLTPMTANAQPGRIWYWYTYPDTSHLELGDQVEVIVVIEGMVFDGLDLWTTGPTTHQGSPAFDVVDTPKWYLTGDLCSQCWLHYDVSNPDGGRTTIAYTIRITERFESQKCFGVFLVDGNAYALLPQLEFGYGSKIYLPSISVP